MVTINYIAETNLGDVVHCIQEEGDNDFRAYILTPDHMEPVKEVVLVPDYWEIPKGNSTIEQNIRHFLEEKI